MVFETPLVADLWRSFNEWKLHAAVASLKVVIRNEILFAVMAAAAAAATR